MSKSWYAITNKTAESADVEIYDEIGGWGVSAKEFIKGLQGLKGQHLNLRINSPGGSIVDGQAIISALKRHAAGFTAYVDGLAASMASVIACAADNTYMADGAMMMIHRASTVSMGDAEDLRKDADLLEKFEKGLISVYSKKTGMDEASIGKMLDEETWMDSLEAVALGFADGITDNLPAMAKVTPNDLRARFDNFKNGMATPKNTESEPVAPVVEPVVEPISPVEPPAEPVVETVVEKVEEKVEEVIEKVEEVVEEVVKKIENPLILAKANEIAAKFADLTAKLDAEKSRADLAEAKLAATNDALSKLEASLGVAAPKREAKIAPAEVPANQKLMSLEKFQALNPAEKSAFMRIGGRLTD